VSSLLPAVSNDEDIIRPHADHDENHQEVHQIHILDLEDVLVEDISGGGREL
jgi:hypothetical protein